MSVTATSRPDQVAHEIEHAAFETSRTVKREHGAGDDSDATRAVHRGFSEIHVQPFHLCHDGGGIEM